MTVLDHPWVGLLIAMLMGVLGKFIWDRYLSHSSRVTRHEFMQSIQRLEKECELKREGCQQHRFANKAQMESLIKESVGLIRATQAEGSSRLNQIVLDEDKAAKLALHIEELALARRQEIRQMLLSIMMVQIQICEALNQSGLLKGASLDVKDLRKMMGELVRSEQ